MQNNIKEKEIVTVWEEKKMQHHFTAFHNWVTSRGHVFCCKISENLWKPIGITVRAPVFGRHQFFSTSEHYGKARGSLLSGWLNYNYTVCCLFPTSSSILILPSQFWQIRFESYWLHCSKCRILVFLTVLLLTRWRLVLSILGLGPMRIACYTVKPEAHIDMILFEVFIKNIHLIPQDQIVQSWHYL